MKRRQNGSGNGRHIDVDNERVGAQRPGSCVMSRMLDERRSLTDTSKGRIKLCREERREEIKAGGRGEQDLFLGRPQLGKVTVTERQQWRAALW